MGCVTRPSLSHCRCHFFAAGLNDTKYWGPRSASQSCEAAALLEEGGSSYPLAPKPIMFPKCSFLPWGSKLLKVFPAPGSPRTWVGGLGSARLRSGRCSVRGHLSRASQRGPRQETNVHLLQIQLMSGTLVPVAKETTATP